MAKKAKVYTGAEWVDLANAATDLSQYASLTTYQPTFRNILINGDFSIWQRGTTFNTNNSYSADRWYIALKSLTTGTRETLDLPPGFRYGFRFFNTNSTSGPAISQYIETDSVIPIRNKIVTFSFWTKVTDFSDVITPSIYYSTGGDTISSYGLSGQEITNLSVSNFGAPNTWTRVSTSFTVPENALGLSVGIRVNSTQSASSIIRITGAQLELGSVATPFEQRPIGIELALCQRYYQVFEARRLNAEGYANTAGYGYYGVMDWKVEMRTAPVVTLPTPTQTGNRTSDATTTSTDGMTYVFSSVGAGNSYVLYNPGLKGNANAEL
jgi:hypothetical protein